MTTKTEHDVATGEVVVRDMNADELAQYEKDVAKWAKLKADEAKADKERTKAKAALLDKLGITADEAALLLL
jgi:FMN-dependent NADH-azoreductase